MCHPSLRCLDHVFPLIPGLSQRAPPSRATQLSPKLPPPQSEASRSPGPHGLLPLRATAATPLLRLQRAEQRVPTPTTRLSTVLPLCASAATCPCQPVSHASSLQQCPVPPAGLSSGGPQLPTTTHSQPLWCSPQCPEPILLHDAQCTPSASAPAPSNAPSSELSAWVPPNVLRQPILPTPRIQSCPLPPDAPL